ncbi:hypothetical protein Cylst_2997 [Cylindrospermum stagnale PCC 7417]|uniref:Uncharacterized protein n=1 Tax=Cylindrospermum stagnale PCC 7417 TaxID=56107 RepID=K9WYA2_9NOST|nr:hypothetical protein [Cylindrospermum stagnale]AFZ25168.1 hypothetical protein Cylst_2997 [Cylindrospermum stagnale PCC 7417]
MYEQFIDFEGIFNLAVQETEELIKLGFDISEPCLVTPIEWYANRFPEIAKRCNNALLKLIEENPTIINPKLGKILQSDDDLYGF